jgi:hypothetical protein
MQRHGHNHVRVHLSSAQSHNLGQARGEPVAQPHNLIIFEQLDGGADSVVIDGKGAGALEGVLLPAAQPAEWLHGLFRHGRNERPAAAETHRRSDAREGIETRRANRDAAGVRQRLSADAAWRGEEHRRECVECVAQDQHVVGNRRGAQERYRKCEARDIRINTYGAPVAG